MSTHELPRHDDESAAHSLGPDYLKQVWRRRKWAGILATCAALAATAGIVLALPNLYRATATVLVERQEVSEAFVRPSVTEELETRIRTIHERITSRDRLSRVITEYNLYPTHRRGGSVDGAVEQMRKDVQLELKGVDQPNGRIETIAFGLTYNGRNPQLVADVANRLVNSYVNENAHSRERQATGTADVLGQQLTQSGKELDDLERRATNYTTQYGDQLAAQIPANVSALERANTALLANREAQRHAIERRQTLEASIAAEAAGRGTAPDSPQAQLARLKRELTDLRRTYKDEYPEVGRLAAEVTALEKQIAAETAVDIKKPNPGLVEIDNELAALKTQEAVLMKTEADYDTRIQATPARQRELEDLTRGHASARERYQAMVRQYTDARLAATLESGQRIEQFRVLDPAVPPGRAAAPDRLLLTLIGLVVALGLGLATILLTEKLDTSFHTADEVGAFAGVPVLATIRQIPTRVGVRNRRLKGFAGTCAALLMLALIGAGAFYLTAGNEQMVKLTASGGK